MKILIVNNNMKVGGVQKSLCNLLWELERLGQHQVSLLLFAPVGEYMQQLPPGVKLLTADGAFRHLGVSQGECRGFNKLKRGFLAALCRLFGRAAAVKLMLTGQKKHPDEYDCAIAFLHNPGPKAFAGGVQEFVLERTRAKKKIAFIHGDYSQNGGKNPCNDALLARFDKIAACSDGCARVLKEALPAVAHKVYTVANCHNISQIKALAEETPVPYAPDRLHILCVARLSATKGVDRAVRAAAAAVERQLPVTLHIVGGGPMEKQLRSLTEELGISQWVNFYGPQANPYRYLKNADLFLLTSYHEAAPMVIDEAYILGVPTLTTATSSSKEMVLDRKCGWVCENEQQSLNAALIDLAQKPEMLRKMQEDLHSRQVSNDLALAQFAAVINQ